MATHGRLAVAAGILLGCRGDAACVLYPCPMPIAATINVSAANAPTGIVGLSMTISGAVTGTGPCSAGAVSACLVLGGRGNYHVQLQAAGYAPTQLDLSITGADAGCNTCGHVDAQRVTVVMQPAG